MFSKIADFKSIDDIPRRLFLYEVTGSMQLLLNRHAHSEFWDIPETKWCEICSNLTKKTLKVRQ